MILYGKKYGKNRVVSTESYSPWDAITMIPRPGYEPPAPTKSTP